MTVSSFNQMHDVAKLVREIWSPVFMKELRDNTLWPGLIKSAFEFIVDDRGNQVPIKGGDTVKINQITKPSSSLKTIGTDADTFGTSVLSNTQVELKVDKRAVSAYEFEDMAILLSQLEQEDSEIREALMADCREQINDYIVSLISPSTSSPDHTTASTTDFTAAVLSAQRALGAIAKWSKSEPWYCVVAPSYYSDIIDDSTLAGADYGAVDRPVIQGQVSLPRMGFNIFEDNSLSADTGYCFVPSFMVGAFAAPRFKISDLHAQKKFGFVISCDMALGVKQYDSKRVTSIA